MTRSIVADDEHHAAQASPINSASLAMDYPDHAWVREN
jgi:hypothetical protein